MGEHAPPQPHPSRMTEFAGHPLVVGVVPEQSPLVALTAVSLARATGAPALYFAHVDTSRYADVEHPDGSVTPMEGCDSVQVETGDVFVIETPGGGGYGPPA